MAVPSHGELLASATVSAVHLEMRDVYTVDSEQERIAAWRDGHRYDPADRAAWWRPWLDLIAATVARGVDVRRARIVSEPLSEYIRYSRSHAFTNVAAGEALRWLPRRRTSDLALPGNDFWLIDDRLVLFNHFDGDGRPTSAETTEDPATVELCATAFRSVWQRGIPHADYCSA
ncbi:hypothetical protein DPM19_26060 [Actinomadura craniellae]|uniref:DUF6879 domain-containing protein n=1 Tax=Actinomadura craniellae TaxID=2231787 RepID=A0A365GZD4_9ACTN|nr:DUF6879 family protein [Actinomadura craniellae]RAY12190.1 hypothetical protein DPM19_26060 [Actinomadura craniellae]